MLRFAQPGFLFAALAAAGVAVVLHLLARRPPARAPLPTARFLEPNQSEAPRFRPTPTDPVLLALRVLWLCALGAALAGAAWVRPVPGTATVVLLDRGIPEGAWPAAVDSARALLLTPRGEARGVLVLFDTAAVTVPPSRLRPALFDSLRRSPPTAGSSSYMAALQAVPDAVARLASADSAQVALLSPLRWTGWSGGVRPLRDAVWPGAIRLVPLSVGPTAPPADSAAPLGPATVLRGRAQVIGGVARGRYVRAALAAAGWDIASEAATEPRATAAVYVVLATPAPATASALLARARSGATVLVAAPVPDPLRAALPPLRLAAPDDAAAAPAALVFADGPQLSSALPRGELSAPAAARLLAAWDDGRPAVVAVPTGAGCLVHTAVDVEGGTLPFSAGYPLALDRMARACAPPAATGEADRLDAGAVAVLAGPGGPARVALAGTGEPAGSRLTPWLLALALAALLAETGIVYMPRR